jgi:2-polyprenyl-6-methoxyphenol hydroxylase-like FAD-dependent oxidoreductase
MSDKEFDVIIVGAGPAGTTSAIKLAKSGLNVALLDKAIFPRDKICGDALSVDVINQLAMVSDTLAEQFRILENKIPSYGVKIFSPDHNHIDIPFIHKDIKSCGYISPRIDFDNLLFQHVKQYSNIHIYENCTVTNPDITNDKASLQTNLGIFTGKIIIGADGAHSIVAKIQEI